MKIDTHQHFWKYNETEYGWMGPGMEILKSDHLPDKLAPLLKNAGIDGTVAVQARQIPEETDFLLKLADENKLIFGVVGWVDLRSPQLEVILESICYHPRLCGVRHVVHDEPDDRFMLREDFIHGISRLRKYNLTYDLLLFAKHLPVACELVAKFPEQTFVLDHISKPLIKEGVMEPWAEDIKRLGTFRNVSCKISGMVTEADWNNWKPADLTPYMETVLEAFGTDRLMIGSDWPVCTVAGRYEEVVGIAADFITQLSGEEQDKIWAANAKRIYGLDI
jgi:L-fuconolactonase